MAKDKSKKTDSAHEPEAAGPVEPPRLKVKYMKEVAPKVKEKFGRDNPMNWPEIEKIVVNVNVGRHLEGGKLPANVRETVLSTLKQISGQKPVVVKSRVSVSNFKLREGMDVSAIVTLRRDRMWHFLDRLINLATPRIKDFRGLPTKSFDKAGNYSMGLNEQGVFPEIDMAAVSFVHGMNINVVFRNSNAELSRFVLEELGMPFRKAS